MNLTCTRLAVPGIKHCGIEVTETTGTTQFHVAAPNAGPPDRCVITNGRIAPLGKEWLAGYQTFSTWTDASGELCRCIRRSVLIFNAVNLPYFPVPFNDYMWDKAKSRCVSVTTCNSNYATRCIMNRCGMELITENGGKPWWIDPPGWDFRVKKCTDGREVRIGVCAYGFHFYCSCAKWDNVDEALCGFNRNTRITEQPGPYPKSA